VDIGGGTTDIAVLSVGDVVQARSLRCAGNAIDDAIVRYVRREHQLVISPASGERIKLGAGTASKAPGGRVAEIRIKGRDLRTGKSKDVVLTPFDIADAIESCISDIVEFIQRSIEDLPREVRSDILKRGALLSGGGALLVGLDAELERRLGVKFAIPELPMQCVVAGTARVLETLSARRHLLVEP